MNYRRALPADAAALSKFAARMFEVAYDHVMDADELRGYVTSQFTEARQADELRDARTTTFVSQFDDGFAAYAQLVVGNRPDCAIDATRPAELKRIYVDPSFHGAGVARELLHLIEQEATSRQSDVLWLAVWEINQRAIAFYRKQGFQVIGRQGFPIGNEIQSDFVMARPLANELR